MKMVWIPPGKFMMGSPENEVGRSENERQHEVEITRGFYLGVYPVTQREYESVMKSQPSYFSATGSGSANVAGLDTSAFPVESVTWNDAVEFCRRLGEIEGKRYDLPTEAQWEYACRGGVSRPQAYHFGDSLTTVQANFNRALGRTSRVGSYPSNAFGLYDMHGNVWQWCKDCFDDKYYDTSPKLDPCCTSGTLRAHRAGAWNNVASFCRSASRYAFHPADGGWSLGFRLALVPPGSDFTPLFNGKDLTGWKTHPSSPGKWRVEGGHLIGTGPSGFLYSERGDFANFHLRANLRVNDRGLGDVYFRSPFGVQLSGGKLTWPSGYSTRVSDSQYYYFTGSVENRSLATPPEMRVMKRVTDILHTPNEWFTLDIIAEKHRIITKVNDKTAADLLDDRLSFSRGHIVLGTWMDPTRIEFGKLEVKELPPN